MKLIKLIKLFFLSLATFRNHDHLLCNPTCYHRSVAQPEPANHSEEAAAVVKRLLYAKLECGPMPNVMVALPNISGALCSTPQSLADAHY